MRTAAMALMTGLVMALAGCSTTPAGVDGPGRSYNVARSHNGFTGTQALRFGPYRVDMRFDAGALAKGNLKRGLVGALLGCDAPGCGAPRSPQAMALDFVFTGPAGVDDGQCRTTSDGMQCDLGGVRMRFDQLASGFGAWSAETAFGRLRIESRDIEDGGRRVIQWRVFDRNESVLALVSDEMRPGDEPAFQVWIADGHPDDHQALAEVVATLLAHAWHATGA